MRASFASFVFGVAALSACSSNSSTSADAGPPDGPPGPDAPPPDASTPFGCLGKPLPTTAPASITISGTAEEIKNLAASPLAGATVTAYKVSGSSMLTTTSSGTDGTYSLTVSTGGTPLDGYLVGHKDTYIDTWLYPPHALAGDETGGVILMLTTQTEGLLTGLAGVTQDSAKGAIGVVVADCDGNTLAGATVTTSPAGTVVYDSSSDVPSSSAKMTADDGRAYVFNVAPGTVTVMATVNGMTLRQHDVTATAGIVTTTAVEP